MLPVPRPRELAVPVETQPPDSQTPKLSASKRRYLTETARRHRDDCLSAVAARRKVLLPYPAALEPEQGILAKLIYRERNQHASSKHAQAMREVNAYYVCQPE
jgi:hypothetical protein